MDNISYALQLMVVGMATVFLILLIVINGGKFLIKAVNKFAPEEAAAPKKVAAAVSAVDASTKAVIDEVVKQLTGGKGHATKITKK